VFRGCLTNWKSRKKVSTTTVLHSDEGDEDRKFMNSKEGFFGWWRKSFILFLFFYSQAILHPQLRQHTSKNLWKVFVPKKSLTLLIFLSSNNMNYENGFNFHDKSHRYGIRIMWFIIIIIILTFWSKLTLNYVAIYQTNGREWFVFLFAARRNNIMLLKSLKFILISLYQQTQQQMFNIPN
jgi:hypothetical protein